MSLLVMSQVWGCPLGKTSPAGVPLPPLYTPSWPLLTGRAGAPQFPKPAQDSSKGLSASTFIISPPWCSSWILH